MKIQSILTLTVSLWALSACATLPSGGTHVATQSGPVEGYSTPSVDIYKGIPFAAAPIGQRRWKPPAPVQPWTDVLQTKKAGTPCIQPTIDRPGIYSNPPENVSEDCLTLNVWSPKNAENLPVFVWIHGGALRTGAGSEALYDGRKLAKEGVVVVSINYRLGVLGYMAHPELSNESPDGISGNYGLMDQIAALEWVRDNIESFGGDASNVTVAGESAGALSVIFLMTSPKAQGLFHKAISESGYMASQPELKKKAHGMPSAESVGSWLTTQLGAKNLSDLREMDGIELSKQADAAGYMPWGTIDGQYLPDQMVAVFEAGKQVKVPLLAGFNEGEIRSLRALAPEVPESSQAYKTALSTQLGDLAEDWLAIYPSDNLEESILAGPRDSLYGWTAQHMMHSQQEIGQPGYLYYWNHGYPSANAFGLHAFHASEVPYVFSSMEDAPQHWPKAEDTLTERQLSRAVTNYWISFAKTGQPTAQSQPDWPQFDADGAYMEFINEPLPKINLLPGMFELHEQIVCRRRADGTQPWHWNTGIASPVLPDTPCVDAGGRPVND